MVPFPQPRCTGTVKMLGFRRLACSHTPTSPATISSGTSTIAQTNALMTSSLAWMPLMVTEQFCVFIVWASGLVSMPAAE